MPARVGVAITYPIHSDTALLRRVIANHEDIAKRLVETHRAGRLFMWRKALGLINEKGGFTPDALRAEREAKLAARLNHANVVAVFDLVEESVDGQSQQWLVSNRDAQTQSKVG